MIAEYFKTDDEMGALVRAFEACEIHPAEFKHYQHLAVALWYVAHLPFAAASEKMRSGIQRLASAYGKTGYHETITVFWLAMVRAFWAHASADESVAVAANRLISECENKNLIYEYYSPERLNSVAAKTGWVEPDLQPLPVRAC
jgi:hypothetical protein